MGLDFCYTTNQVREFCAKRQRSLRIDNPSVLVDFVNTGTTRSAGGEDWASPGQKWWVRVRDGDSLAFPHSFVCVQGGPPDRAFWRPTDPGMHGQFRYLRIEGV
jgi:hypothetical protein